MKYEKGTFTTIPNLQLLSGLDPQTQCVFMWLCHYANKDGKCYPSSKKLAENCNISLNTLKERMNYLTNLGIVTRRARIENNKQTTNLYEILIKDALNDCAPVKTRKTKVSARDGGGSPRGEGGGRPVGRGTKYILTKSTLSNDNVANAKNDSSDLRARGVGGETPKKDADITGLDKSEDLLSKNIQEIMALFYEINPALNFANKTSRGAAEWMIKKWGIDQVRAMTKKVILCQGQDFAPVATTPYDMKEKLAKFALYFKRDNRPKSQAYDV